MSYKWGLGKKGYLKSYYCEYKDQGNPCIRSNYEKVHDCKMMNKLVKHVLNNNTTTGRRRKNKILHSFIGDRAYDSNTSFKFLKDYNIQLIIKVRSNSVVSPLNNKVRNREVKQQ